MLMQKRKIYDYDAKFKWTRTAALQPLLTKHMFKLAFKCFWTQEYGMNDRELPTQGKFPIFCI